MMRYLLTLILLAAVAGCGGASDPRRLDSASSGLDGFTLTVLPESIMDGGSFTATPHVTADGVVVEVTAHNARNLKVLYFELAYDSSRYTPASAKASGTLPNAIDLAILDQPGVVTHGQAIMHWNTTNGYSGFATVASVNFAYRRIPPVSHSSPRQPSIVYSEVSKAFSEYQRRYPIKYDPDAKVMTWDYSVAGDYDQNGEANISDLSTLALYFGMTVSAAESDMLKGVADGDNNGEVNLADIGKIGMRFHSRVTGYQLYAQPDYSQAYPLFPEETTPPSITHRAQVAFSNAIGDPAAERLSFEFDVSSLQGQFIWVEEVDSEGNGKVSQMTMATDKAWSLAIHDPTYGLEYDSVSQRLNWLFTLRGDHDQNGEVNISDVTPIGTYYLERGPFHLDSAQWIVDSYRDAVVDSKEWAVVGIFLGNRLLRYNVYSTLNASEVPQNPYSEELLDPVAQVDYNGWAYGSYADRRRYSIDLPTASGSYVWIRPVGHSPWPVEVEGTRSQVIQIP